MIVRSFLSADKTPLSMSQACPCRLCSLAPLLSQVTFVSRTVCSVVRLNDMLAQQTHRLVLLCRLLFTLCCFMRQTAGLCVCASLTDFGLLQASSSCVGLQLCACVPVPLTAGGCKPLLHCAGNSGLSWSDVLLGDMPNVYVYAANNPSESILAKRRGYGTIISHNVPPYAR